MKSPLQAGPDGRACPAKLLERSRVPAPPEKRFVIRQALHRWLVVAVLVCSNAVRANAGEAPEVRPPSDQIYKVRYLPAARIVIDGRADEQDWSLAAAEKHFIFPWKQAPAPATEFRALCDGKFLYFTFRIEDADIFVLDKLRDEEDAMFEDRAELYFSRDDKMKDYYCLEVDSRGRAFDYRGTFYRELDPKWNCAGLETKASPLARGYVVEGRIPWAVFEALGFPPLRPGAKILCGIFRAEFSHDRGGKPVEQKESIHNRGRKLAGPPPIEEWMAWVDPHTKEPDFHVPSSLGWLEITK
jgi:hypothetical protein